MTPFEPLCSRAYPLLLSGVDTDQLVPARFLRRTRAQGYGSALLHDLRFDDAGAERPAFPLNDASRRGAAILVARRNFGGGSSREAAVYALLDFGIRCVIAPSFGDIFASNAVNNGLLPAVLPERDVEVLLAEIADPAARISVDLADRRIATRGIALSFSIARDWQVKLLNGWDDIDLSRDMVPTIDAFAVHHQQRQPWLIPARK